MKPLETFRKHLLREHASFAADLAGEAPPAASLRADALATFCEEGLPSTRQEEWRYTNVTPIARVTFERPEAGPLPDRAAVESLAFPLFACGLIVFVNGRYAPGLSAPRSLTGRVGVESLAALRADAPETLEGLGARTPLKSHPFAALNTAFLDDGAVLRVPRGVVDEHPIHVVFLSTDSGAPAMTHPRLLLEAEAGSRVTLIQDHVTLGGTPGLTNAVTEVDVGPTAQVDLVILQREHDQHFHVSGLHVRQQRGSRFSCHTLTLGGALVRNDAQVLLGEEGAECRLEGLFVGGGEQVQDNHTFVDHAVPHCTSQELYKGVLGGSSRGVFSGRVVVRPHAQQTVASQSNPNLLIGRGAEVDTKPQLEIYADDVRCTHGSSIGQLDLEALFYLRTRGIDAALANDLLTRAFAAEVMENLPVKGLAAALDPLLRGRLRHASGENLS